MIIDDYSARFSSPDRLPLHFRIVAKYRPGKSQGLVNARLSIYMLTDRGVIDAVVDVGELIEWKPADRRLAIHRTVLLRPQPFTWLSEMKGDERDALEIIRKQTIQQIDDYIHGDLTTGQSFKSLGRRLLVCEWKRPTRAPGMRILGTFLAPEIFVGIKAFARDDLPFRHRPNSMDGANWREVVVDCLEEHARIFPANHPIHRDVAVEYEEEND
jgi:hypothetical protein